MNIFVLNKGGSKTGILSNQGANPPAPFFDDLYTQELETGADTYYFSTISNSYTQDLLYVGNKVMFEFGNKQKLFTIASIEYEHKDGQKIIGVYAEGIGFELLDIFMHKPKIQSSGSGSGNDSDGDGDDHLDDEYGDPDDVWIDEDGNIVYIKNNKENGSDYGSPDDVWIDEDGNICYKKNKSKNKNRDNSSLKLTNISYTKFLNLILKNTGWTYVVDPELDRNKQDMEIRYDTNIYAILQDSMQTYQGVELEFIYEYNNGNIRKVVKAYRNGGRGSITGKRLQYGVNIRGITKLQEIADEKEENIIYDESVSTVNGYRVQLTYDVDIALKSLDVHDMRIGDTYTVIDHEFRPAMQFNARIGKIEISFSDMTRNKCYLANFKKIKGAVSEDEENNPIDDIIKNAIEDYLEDDDIGDDDIVDDGTGDGGTGGIVAEDHEHGAIAYDKTNTKIGAHWENYMYIDREAAGVSFDGKNAVVFNNNGSLDVLQIDTVPPAAPTPPNSAGPIESTTTKDQGTTEGDVHRASAGQIARDPRYGYDSTSYEKTSIWGTGVHTPATDAFSHRVYCSKKDVLRDTYKEIPSDSSYTDPNLWSKANKKDMVNFIKELCIFETVHGMLSPTFDYNLSGFDTGALITDRHNGLYKMVYKEAPNVIGLFTEHEEGSGLNQVSADYTYSYDLGSLLMTQIGAFQSHLESHSGAGSDGIYATIEYADYIKDIANSAASKATTATETAKSASNNVEVYSSLVNELKSVVNGWRTNENEIDGEKIHPNTIGKEALKHNILTGDHVQKRGSDLPDNQILVTNDLSDSVTDNISNKPASRAAVKKAYDKAVEALNALNGGGGSDGGSGSGGLPSDVFEVIDGKLHIYLPIEFEESANFTHCTIGTEHDRASLTGAESIDAMTIYCANINPIHDGSGIVEIKGDLEVTGSIVLSKDSDIIIQDYFDSGDAFISASELYEAVSWYIVNSASTANIDLSDEQQETISELQATVQQQQETIATLEARLARLEQHLGLSDDI